MLAPLVGFLGDFELAEEAAQDAFAAAAERWPRDGSRRIPAAWLITTARNRADRPDPPRPDVGRQDPPARAVRGRWRIDVTEIDDDTIPDERLELLFTCCHPALSIEAQVALTLRALGGLTNDEIARAFLVTPETMKRRLSRARAKIKLAGIPFSVPPDQPAAGAARRGPGRHLPDLQRGLRRPHRSGRGGDRAWAAYWAS